MRIALIRSMFLALMVGISGAAHAAPVATGGEPVVAAAASPDVQVMTINLNTADEATLQRELSGVGAAKAKAIVAYREANGAFASTDELLEVKGIGKAIFDKNRDRVAVN
ncbi:helix-hairpin-helix domain-containing protein [Pseudomonas sp. SIMBA_077]